MTFRDHSGTVEDLQSLAGCITKQFQGSDTAAAAHLQRVKAERGKYP